MRNLRSIPLLCAYIALAMLPIRPASAIDGVQDWAKRIRGSGMDASKAVASDPMGDVIIAGSTDSPSINMGGGNLSGTGTGMLIGAFTPSGAHKWSRRVSSPNTFSTAIAVASDPSGNVLVAGEGSGAGIDLGTGPLADLGGDDILVAKYSASGAPVWSKRLGGNYIDIPNSITTDPSGNVIVAGYTASSSIELGGGALFGQGVYDAFVVKFAPDGAFVWSKLMGSEGREEARSVATDFAGNILLTGYTDSPNLDLGGSSLAGAGYYDLWFAKFSSSGDHMWSKRVGGFAYEIGYAIAADPSGNVVLGASGSSPAIDLGGGPLSGHDSMDLLLAKYSPLGVHLWSQRRGGDTRDDVMSMAISPNGRIVLTGLTNSPLIDLGGGGLAGPGGDNWDTVIGHYSPDGQHLWSRRIGGSGVESLEASTDASGNVLLAGGSTSPSINLEGSSLSADSAGDIIIARFRIDETAPTSTLDQPLVGSSLNGSVVTGSVTDDIAGVKTETITAVSVASGATKVAPAILNCDVARLRCTFRVSLTLAPGLYSVQAQAIDRAKNAESAGAMGTLVVV